MSDAVVNVDFIHKVVEVEFDKDIAMAATRLMEAATAAAASAVRAETWAEGTDAQVGVLGGEHSAKGWAEVSGRYANAASTSAGAAKASENAAAESAREAAGINYLIRKNSTTYTEGAVAFAAAIPSPLVLECTTAGTTGAAEPSFSGAAEGDTVTDGTVVWTYKNLLSGDGSDGSGGVPVGFIMPYAGTGLAEGWLDCDGSAVSRTMYPDLFAAIGTTFGPGDGSTTFNLPDEQYAKAWVGSYGSGATAPVFGDGSALNLKTGISTATQTNPFLNWNSTYRMDYSSSSSSTGVGVIEKGDTPSHIYADLNAAPDATITPQYSSNIRYMIKAFDGQTPDSALIDITQYAADLANKATRSFDNLTDAGKDRFLGDDNFCILYPNGGSEGSPANVTVNSKYVMDNPFSGYYVNCMVEIQDTDTGKWAPISNIDYYSGSSRLGMYSYQFESNIVVMTGKDGLCDGNVSEFAGRNTAPCRVKVWKVGKI